MVLEPPVSLFTVFVPGIITLGQTTTYTGTKLQKQFVFASKLKSSFMASPEVLRVYAPPEGLALSFFF